MPHPGEEFGAPGFAERVGAGLGGQVGEVIPGGVENLKGIAPARHLGKQTPGLGRQVLRADLACGGGGLPS